MVNVRPAARDAIASKATPPRSRRIRDPDSLSELAGRNGVLVDTAEVIASKSREAMASVSHFSEEWRWEESL